MALPALIGGITRAASMAGKARSATKLLPGGKKGGAIVPQERPGLTQFAGEAEKRKERARPTIDKSAFFNAPKIGDPKKSKDKMQNAENKISTISQFIKDTNKKRKEAFKSFLQSEEDETRKEKEKDKENIASKLVKGAKNRVLAPVKSLFDSILNIIGNLILGKIAMWAIDNPKLFGNILKAIAAVADFMIDMFIKVVDIFAGIIDFGYGLVDGFREWVGGTFGEDVGEQLDKIAPAILAFLNIAAIVGTALLALAGRRPPRGPKDTKRPKKPGARPDPDVNPRKRKGVTTSGGKRKGFKGKLDRLADKNPFRKKPKVTGGDDFFSKASRKLDQLNPLSGGAKSVTTSGGRRTGFRGLKDKVDDLNPLKKKPKITGSGSKPGFFDNLNPFKKKPKVTGGGGPSFMDRLKKLGGDALELGRKGVKKLEQGAEFVLEQGGRLGRFVSAQYKKVTEGLGEWAKKNSPKFTAVLDWLSKRKGALGDFAKKMKPVLGKIGKYIPFIGDVVGFGLDLIQGIDWRRALIRAVVGAGIDAGFAALMGSLGVAAPFTGGASGLLATAIYAAYMGVDIAAGGFGRILGDKISDFLKIPMYAGEKESPVGPKSAGSESDVKKLTEKIEKKMEEDPEFAEKINKSTAVSAPNTADKKETPKPDASKSEPESEKKPTVTPQNQLIPTSLGSGAGSLKLTDQDYSDLAYIVSHEAARGTDDEYGVAAAVLNRVADPRYPDTIMGVGTAPGQFEAVFKGLAKRDPALAKKLKQNSGKIIAALKKLNGRTDFKGQSMLKFKGDGDVMFDSRGNFFHYAEQQAKSDPPPANPPEHWKKLLGALSKQDDTSEQRISTEDNSDKVNALQTPSGQGPTSNAAAAVPTLSSSSTSQSSAVQSKPQVGSQGMTPLPIPVGGGAGGGRRSVSVVSGGNSLNSFYKAQLIGFLYKQG